MEERLQKLIARAGIASRRHAEQLIVSGQVRVNGRVVAELGSKADPSKDRIEAAGRVVEGAEPKIYLIMNKPVEVVSTLADPEGRKTLRNLLRGLGQRVYPVGRLDYAASGLVFLTNDGDLAAEMLKAWGNLQQVYHVKIKGMLRLDEMERIGRESGARLQTIRQPDSSRGHGENYWYEVAIQDSKKDILRRVLMTERHPVEKLKRIALGPMSLEGIPQGRYRTMNDKEIEALRLAMRTKPKLEIGAARTFHATGRETFEKKKELRPERTHKTLWKKAGEKRQPWKRGGSHKPRGADKPEWRKSEGNASGEKREPWKKNSRSAGKPEWKKRDEKKPEQKRGLREKWRRAGAAKREK
jgi:23S rRNA pseudouridine2605 synthase